MRVLGAVLTAISLVLTAPAHAQAPAGDPFEAVAEFVETSWLNGALPTFAPLFWAFEPEAIEATRPGGALADDLEAGNPGVASAVAREGLRRNLPRLEAYARDACARLTPDQKLFLNAYVMMTKMHAHAAVGVHDRVLRAQFPTFRPEPISAASLQMTPDCNGAVTSGPDGISISTDIVLNAVLSAMFADSQLYLVPPRALSQMESVLQDAGRRFDRRKADGAFERIQRSPVWQNYLRQRRLLLGDVSKPLDRFEKEDVYDAMARRQSLCRVLSLRCKISLAAAYSYLSVVKFDMYFREQLQFIIGHEMGHQALGHTTIPIGSCATERALEAAADRFGMVLVRPRTGHLFTPPKLGPDLDLLSTQLDTQFTSGLDLFMLQSHRLSNLTDGDSCAYPTFEERLAHLRAFEATVFGSAAAPTSVPPARRMTGEWTLRTSRSVGRATEGRAMFSEEGLVFRGRVEEGAQSPVANGKQDAAGSLTFQKTYRGAGGHSVFYYGSFTGPGQIAGWWKGPNGTSGWFEMTRR